MQAKERENPSSWTELQQTKRLTDDSTNMASAHTGKLESPSAVDFNRFSSIPEDFEASNMPPPPENMADIPWVSVSRFCIKLQTVDLSACEGGHTP